MRVAGTVYQRIESHCSRGTGFSPKRGFALCPYVHSWYQHLVFEVIVDVVLGVGATAAVTAGALSAEQNLKS